MRSLILLLLLLFTACSSVPVQPQNYRLNTITTPNGVALASNDFYSVYYVYMNVIRAMELDAVLSRAETEQVISRVIDTLKHGNGAQIVIPNYNGGLDLRATLRTDFQISKDNIPNLLVVSNYDAKLKRAVAGDMQKDAYATYFIIADDKLIKHQYIDEPKSQADLNAMSLNNLANYYLMDMDDANDRLGKVMLERALPGEQNIINKFIMYLTLSEYHLLEGDVDKARQQLSAAEAIIDAQSDARTRQRMALLYSYASDIVYYYGKYHH
jgi:hypothetical protein